MNLGTPYLLQEAQKAKGKIIQRFNVYYHPRHERRDNE